MMLTKACGAAARLCACLGFGSSRNGVQGTSVPLSRGCAQKGNVRDAVLSGALGRGALNHLLGAAVV